MGLKGKIRQLMDPELRARMICEGQRRKCNERRTFPLTAEALMRDLDRDKLEIIRANYAVANPGIHKEKYLEIERWLTTNIWRVFDIGLDLKRKKRILDLGSGAGFFLYVCRWLGHDVLGLDMHDPTAEWYGEMLELFGVRRVIWRINPFVKLPDLGPRFDYVCAFMVCFNRHASPEEWKIEEWRFFLDDLWTRLKPGAIVWLELNPGLNGAHYTPELRSYFESRGAIVDGKRLLWGLDEPHYRALLHATKVETFAARHSGIAGEAGEGQILVPSHGT